MSISLPSSIGSNSGRNYYFTTTWTTGIDVVSEFSVQELVQPMQLMCIKAFTVILFVKLNAPTPSP